MTQDGLFTILNTVDSTNNYAMQQVHDGLAKHGSAWFTTHQTAGKGQRGKHWTSEKGKNIAMSVVLEPGRFLAGSGEAMISQFYLSAAVALACLEFLKTYAGEEMKIKWPNDMFWRDRKAGGILVENKFQGNAWRWAVVGIGININQTAFNTDLVNPVSLKQITGKTFDAVVLAKELHALVMQHLSATTTMDKILQQYNRHLYKLNESVTLRKGGVKFKTVIKEVSPQGKLITVDAMEREFDFGEVEWVLPR